jgi:hypothetical protein
MFFKMMEAYINQNFNEEMICIYYDSWENDFFYDPLLSMLTCFKDSIESKDNVTSDDLKVAGKTIFYDVLKSFTKGSFDLEKIESALNQNEERELINEFEREKGSRKIIRKMLHDLSMLPEEYRSRKVVFLIDELDRCKPTFALGLIETMKHFFDAPNYYFVMAVDKEQLGSTIKRKYGDNIDDMGYLRRFIDFEITMTPMNINSYVRFYRRKLNIKSDEFQWLFKSIELFSEINNLTLRDLDKIFAYLRLIFPIDDCFLTKEDLLREGLMSNSESYFTAITTEKNSFDQAILGFMLVLKVVDSELYRDIIDKNTLSEFNNRLLNFAGFNKDTIGYKIAESFLNLYTWNRINIDEIVLENNNIFALKNHKTELRVRHYCENGEFKIPVLDKIQLIREVHIKE